MKHAQSRRATNPSGSTTPRTKADSFSIAGLFRRKLDADLIVVGDDWLGASGVQQQLEFEGFQLRWVTDSKLDETLADGWRYVTVSHYLWWHRRVRRRHGPRSQYLLKRAKSFRSRGNGG